MTTTREQVDALNLSISTWADDMRTWERLHEITTELIGFHRELAMLVTQERQARLQAYMDRMETSVSGRERVAEYATLDISAEIIKVKGEIAAFTEERDFLRLVLGGSSVENHGGSTDLSTRPPG